MSKEQPARPLAGNAIEITSPQQGDSIPANGNTVTGTYALTFRNGLPRVVLVVRYPDDSKYVTAPAPVNPPPASTWSHALTGLTPTPSIPVGDPPSDWALLTAYLVDSFGVSVAPPYTISVKILPSEE